MQIDECVDVFENDITANLKLFCEENNIENEFDIFPSQWNAALDYIYKRVIKNNPDLLTIPHTISNSYNLDAVNELLDIYIYMCYLHNQEISISGFCKLSGISRDTIHSWGNNNTRSYIYKDLNGNIINDIAISNLKEDEYVKESSTTASDIYKKIVENNEESLVCLLKDRRNNPMKYLPILNKRHNWNLPGVSKETSNKNNLSLEDMAGKIAELTQNTNQTVVIDVQNDNS